MPLPQLPASPSEAEVVAAFRAAAVFFHGQFQRALAGLCLNLGGVFRDAAQSLYRAADVIEKSPAEGLLSADAEELERAERALGLVLARLGGWTELHDYIAELEYRRTGVRPAPESRPTKTVQRRARGTARYLVAELVPTIAPVLFEFPTEQCETAIQVFDERAEFHRASLKRVVPMILVDRRRGVVLKSVGDLSDIDLAHHAVDDALSLQPPADSSPTANIQPASARRKRAVAAGDAARRPQSRAVPKPEAKAPVGRGRRRFVVTEVVYSMNAGAVWAVGCITLDSAIRSFERRVARNVLHDGESGAVMAFDRRRRRLVCWTDEITDPIAAARYWFR